MSGHNKWAQIKHKKAATDKARGKAWSKLSKRLSVESKLAAGDTTSPTLRTLIEKAKKENMPKENIERAVAKGISSQESSMEAITYEAYGPGGAAILIQALTDSRNRTAQEIKHLLSKNGLSLASPGSASWAFQKTGDGFEAVSEVAISDAESSALMLLLEEIEEHDDVEDVYTNAN